MGNLNLLTDAVNRYEKIVEQEEALRAAIHNLALGLLTADG